MITDFNFDEHPNKPKKKKARNFIKKNGIQIRKSHYIYCKYHRIAKIPENHVIHHKNGNKYDDRIENLELLSLTDHTRLHNKLRSLET